MAYFPFFTDLSRREGLIAGGGAVALRKAKALLEYDAKLTVAAPELLPEFRELPGVRLIPRPFAPELLEGKWFVIAATDDPDENRKIAVLCRQRNILVNVVDDREACTFLFPALVHEGCLSVGISTGGASPSGAGWLKNQIRALLPDNFGELLEYLGAQRETVRTAFPTDEKRRAAVYARLFDACMAAGRPLHQEEFDAIIRQAEERT